jgi:hypothetical protein
VNLVAADLVAHWQKRLETMDGKAMVVCHESAHLRRVVQRARDAAPRMAPRLRTTQRA